MAKPDIPKRLAHRILVAQRAVDRVRHSLWDEGEAVVSDVAGSLTLKAAETRLAEIEADVLAEVARMKPTPGRVPWPKPLKSIKQAFAQYGRDRDREEAREAREEERERLEDERVEAAENVANALADALEDIEWFGEAAGLTRAERQKLKREARAHAKEGTIVNVRFER